MQLEQIVNELKESGDRESDLDSNLFPRHTGVGLKRFFRIDLKFLLEQTPGP